MDNKFEDIYSSDTQTVKKENTAPTYAEYLIAEREKKKIVAKEKNKVQSLLIGVICFLLIVIILLFAISNSTEEIDDDLITLNEFNDLDTGMSRTEVYDIVGSFGTLISESSSGDYKVQIYSYEGYGSVGANASITFANGKLEGKAQYGLESYYGKHNDEEVSNQNTQIFKDVSAVKIDDINLDITIRQPNSINTVYMDAVYVNNSQYAITSFSIKVLLKDKNDKTYLTCCDTVLPGETSPKFNSFGPQTQSRDDIEFLECDYSYIDNNGEEVYVTYDYKLQKYEVL